MRTLKSFIREHGIRMSAELTEGNPNMHDMPEGSTHWLCTFKRPGATRMRVHFRMGPAHSREPTAKDVLDCLASDAAGVENARTFEEWASEYGFDTDSRKAERTYRACEKQTEKLRTFLGDEEIFEELLFKVERD